MELTKQVKIKFVVTAIVDMPSECEPHVAEGYSGVLVANRLRQSLEGCAMIPEHAIEFDSIVHNP